MSEKRNIMKTETSEHASGGIVQRFFSRQIKELLTRNFWRAILSEILGTLFLCAWTIGAGMHKEGDSVELLDLALTAGFVVALTITALLNASGGHINPAVSIGFFVTGHISTIRFIFYFIAQLIAGILAVFLCRALFPEDMWGNLGLLHPGAGVEDWQAFACEFCITFLLLFVVFAYIDQGRSDVKGSPILFMGLAIAVNVLFGARISGACMNPARNFGPALVTGNLDKQWIYWAGPLLGGVVGTLVYEKLLSVKAIASTCIGGCCGSRDQEDGDAFEGEAMLNGNNVEHKREIS